MFIQIALKNRLSISKISNQQNNFMNILKLYHQVNKDTQIFIPPIIFNQTVSQYNSLLSSTLDTCLQLSIILETRKQHPRGRVKEFEERRTHAKKSFSALPLPPPSPPPPRLYVLFISSFDAPAAVPFAFGSRAPPSMHHRTWTSPKRNKFQIRSLLLFALSLMRRVEP